MSVISKSVGRIYQQTFVDTYSKVAFAKLYTTRTPITAPDGLPFFKRHEFPMLRILTDRGTKYCSRIDHHDYQLYLVINDIDKTKAKSPQNNKTCNPFFKAIASPILSKRIS
jgi:hypothetical protein